MHPASTAAFWNQRWEEGRTGFHEGVVNRHLQRFWPGAGSVLVPLCGKSADLAWLAERADVTGVELSPIACAAVAPRVGREGAFEVHRDGRLTVLQGDVFDVEGSFELAWDRAALIALPPELRPRYATHLQALCGRILLVTMRHTAADGPPFSVDDAVVTGLFPGARELHRERLDDPRWSDAEEVVWDIRHR